MGLEHGRFDMSDNKYILFREENMIKGEMLEGFKGDDLISMVQDVIKMEEGLSPVPDKLAIVKASMLKLNFQTMLSQSIIRRSMDYCSNFKTAIVVNNSFNYGVVRVWQTLMDSPKAEIQIFQTEDEAYDFLKNGVLQDIEDAK